MHTRAHKSCTRHTCAKSAGVTSTACAHASAHTRVTLARTRNTRIMHSHTPCTYALEGQASCITRRAKRRWQRLHAVDAVRNCFHFLNCKAHQRQELPAAAINRFRQHNGEFAVPRRQAPNPSRANFGFHPRRLELRSQPAQFHVGGTSTSKRVHAVSVRPSVHPGAEPAAPLLPPSRSGSRRTTWEDSRPVIRGWRGGARRI